MSQPSPESPGYLHKRKTCFLSPGPAHTLLLLSFVTQTCLLDFLWFWTHFKFFLPKVIPGLLLLSLSWSSQVPAYLLGIFLVVAGKDIHFLPGRTHFSPLQWASWASIPPEAAVQKCPITVLLSVFFSFWARNQGVLSIQFAILFLYGSASQSWVCVDHLQGLVKGRFWVSRSGLSPTVFPGGTGAAGPRIIPGVARLYCSLFSFFGSWTSFPGLP